MFEIGNTLREARVRRKVTLQQAEQDTKIRVKYIQAMENEDFEIMPGPTYVKGFLRTYSTYLNLDPDVIVGEYQSRGLPGKTQPEPFGGSSIIGAQRRHRGRNTVLLVAVLCLLVLAVIYILGLNGQEPTSPTTQPSALGLVSPSPSTTASPAADGASAVADQVRVSAIATTWIQVRKDSADGKILFSGSMRKGTSRVFTGDVMWLRLASPPNVRLRVAGEAQPAIPGPGPKDFIVMDGKLKEQG